MNSAPDFLYIIKVGVHKYSIRYEHTKQKKHSGGLSSPQRHASIVRNNQKGGYSMADWLTLKQLSEKRGIPENTLRYWKSLNYIASSTIDNVVMLDDNSVTRFLDANQTKELEEDYLKQLIQEKKAECEATLAYFEDELYLLKTQKLYQPLFHIVIEELGALITDDYQREIFLAISKGEPIARVAARHQLTYVQTANAYSNILEKLGENTNRISTFRHRTMELLYSRFDTTDPTNTRIGDILETHANAVLKTKANIENVRETATICF